MIGTTNPEQGRRRRALGKELQSLNKKTMSGKTMAFRVRRRRKTRSRDEVKEKSGEYKETKELKEESDNEGRICL